MLDAKIKQILDRVIQVETSHEKDPSGQAMLADDWKFIFKDLSSWVVLKVTTSHRGGYWMHSSLYPASKIDEAYSNDLHKFSINPNSAAYGHVMSGDEHWLEPYWGNNERFDTSEVPMYFERFYYGRPKGEENYIEFNQLVTHPLGLDWSPSKNSYCSINDLGEEIEKIKLVSTDGVEIVLIRRRTLDKLLHLGNWVLVRYFDFNRWVGKNHSFDNCETQEVEKKDINVKFEIRTCGGKNITFSEFRGVQIERPITPKSELLYRFA